MTMRFDLGDAKMMGSSPFPWGCFARLCFSFAVTLQIGCWPEAWAINKCVVDGRTIFQDAPCEENRETVAQAIERKQRNEVLHRRLDMLAAQGQGMVQRAPAAPSPQPVRKDESLRNMSRAEFRAAREAQWARAMAENQERSERTNAESAAGLTRMIDDAKKACGGKMDDRPKLGMSDENFRLCTMHARFGGINQVVVSEDGKVPLRLYISPSGPARRVYSIGGVVTAISD